MSVYQHVGWEHGELVDALLFSFPPSLPSPLPSPPPSSQPAYPLLPNARMPLLHTRYFFAKLSHYFARFFGRSQQGANASNIDTPGPQLSTSSDPLPWTQHLATTTARASGGLLPAADSLNAPHRMSPSSSVSHSPQSTPQPTGTLSPVAHSLSLMHHPLTATPLPLHTDALPVASVDLPPDRHTLSLPEACSHEAQPPSLPQCSTISLPVDPYVSAHRTSNQAQGSQTISSAQVTNIASPSPVNTYLSGAMTDPLCNSFVPPDIDPLHVNSSHHQSPTATSLPIGVNHPTEPQMLVFQHPPSMDHTPSSSSLPQSREPRMFDHTHNLTFNHTQFINNAQLVAPTGSGLKTLYEHSMPDGFHNLAACFPPARCHLETQRDYIDRICNQWALGKLDPEKFVMWLHGPFGIGKTAVAQSSAEELEAINKLLATLFFSHSNANHDDPRCVFPSLAYQIATVCKSLAALVDARI
ncbi:hypothetical protein NP233_g10856 [Leucocoprinus birnbaumii]|uniref:Nephrocystin 3-like N-terminal domain-containing protein n=1 Tax=Leucocoprinus birnbaumii TaxID=56174 RepID=A0AAD5YLT1_9AGAR|nr:hypothetical protein NP233_g10856 [Leucocoprinus birnbaumii]